MSFDITTAATMLSAMQGRTVLVIGDVMLDRFVDGHVSRISPEAPVPVLGQSSVRQMAGGAANVAANMARLGITVTLIGICGDDEAGTALIDELAQHSGITFTPIRIAGRPTSVKTRFRAAGQQILRVDDETVAPIDADTQAHCLKLAADHIKSAALVVLSDYAKGALPPALISALITAAKQHQKPVVVDPKLADLSVYRGASLITPNLAELSIATNLADTQLEAVGQAATQLAQQCDFAHILTTLSARGMLLNAANGDQIHDPATARDVFDVSGAGDTVVATMAGALAAGCTIDDAMRLANRAAGVVVGKSGTATVVPGEIIGHMGGDPPATDWQSNATLCTSWRQSGQTIAFANGCFDMLHAGHLYLLQAAADQADRLIVGLNGDRSVKRLKGESRPLQPATMRATVLASLPFVDGVVIFDEDTPFDLITTLQPDIIVKGGDYQVEDIVGADIVAARGGKTVIVPTLPGHSTSLLVNRY